MNLNVSVTSPPVIEVSDQDIGATIITDIIIDVLEDHEVIPVACISVEISATFAVEIIGNNLAGWLKLRKFSTYLRWSKIGKLHMHTIQSLTSSILKTVLIPYLNLQLQKGIPLPNLNGFSLENARILYSPPWIGVYSDVSFSRDYYLTQLASNVSQSFSQSVLY
uniref:Lipid-binding serum glycoprotein C-terminal domain-containing protein n=1 Tax=Lotus japonicus TaxID=34305 RepID=I3T272_LOTJA|nr:unknown [Lotus japonicus]